MKNVLLLLERLSGVLELFEVKQMFEKMGNPKTHLECKQIIGTTNYFTNVVLGASFQKLTSWIRFLAEVDTTGKGAINFNDFMRVYSIEQDDPLIKAWSDSQMCRL
jgi:hypothetical protein